MVISRYGRMLFDPIEQRRIVEYDRKEALREEREQEMISKFEDDSYDLLDALETYGEKFSAIADDLKQLKDRIKRFEYNTGNEVSDETYANIKAIESYA